MSQPEVNRPQKINDLIPQVKRRIKYEEMLESLSEGSPILISGIKFTGKEGYLTKVISILSLTQDKEGLNGWCFQHRFRNPDEYENEGLHRIGGKDVKRAALPDTMFTVIAEVEASLVDETNPEVIKQTIDRVLSLDKRS